MLRNLHNWRSLYRASTIPSSDAIAVPSVEAHAFAQVLDAARRGPTVVKLDVEGVERDLIAAIDFADYPNIERLFCESTDCGTLIRRRHERTVRNGYVEDLKFLPLAP